MAVVDPRSVFTARERFPMVDELINKKPQAAENILEISHENRLVILSHDEKIDLPALRIGLDKWCDYIGLLASNLTKKKRFSSLASMEYKQYRLRMLSSPIGLNIKADQPEEIAVAIMAEIIART